MAKESFIGGVNDSGKLAVITSKLIGAEIARHKGKRVLITVERFSSKRSLPQNSFMHLVLQMFTDELNKITGNDMRMSELKEMMKRKFAMIDVINENTGEIIGERIKGTSEMSKMELMQFLDNVILYAQDMFGIVLPKEDSQLEAL